MKSLFRLTTVVLDHSAPLVNESVEIPQTVFELAVNKPAPLLEISAPESASSDSSFALKAVVLSNNLFDNAAMLSSILHVSVAAARPSSSGATPGGLTSSRRLSSADQSSFKVVLQNNKPLSSAISNTTQPKIFALTCKAGIVTSLNKTCLKPEGNFVYLHCNGSETGLKRGRCPSLRAISTCESLNASSTFTCELVDSTKDNITCLCSQPPLLDSPFSTMDVVSILGYLQDDFVTTWEQSVNLDIEVIAKSVNVIVALGSIIVCFAIGFVWLPRLDNKAKLKVEADENRKEENDDDTVNADFEDRSSEASNYAAMIEKKLKKSVPAAFSSKYTIVQFLYGTISH